MSTPFAIQHTNHEEMLDEFVPLHHRSKPGRMGLLQAIARTFQRLEDVVYDAHVSNSLPHAKGSVLDFYGWLAGVQREGLTDDWYRPLIATAFQAKRSAGSVNEIIDLWKTATVNPVSVEFTRYKKNLVIVTAWRDNPLPPEYAQRAGEVVSRGCPVGSVVLQEAPLQFVGSEARDYYPLPATQTSAAYPARVWWPQI